MRVDPPRPGLQRSVRSDPDYVYWRAKELWSLNEAAKLLCGRDPVQKYPTPQRYNRSKKVIEIIDLAFEAVKAKTLKAARNALMPIHIQVEPKEFLRWAMSAGFVVPPELMTLLDERAGATADFGPDERAKDLMLAIARTLAIVDPRLTLEEIHAHRAMREILGESRPSLATLRSLLEQPA